ncbi:MAG: orotidine-5'-phosphate decarboxylase [Jatrophihabitantaceae bacterium]
MSFGERLIGALDARGSACIGIDPHASLLLDWGLADDLVSLERFALTCVEAFADLAAVVKPQSAFFERFGSRGIGVLERTIAEARAAGALVLLDVKRGDIGSTMAAYADAYLDPASTLAADAITVNPYLGVGALDPAFELATKHQAGIFVIGLTSNKEAPQVQHARLADGRTVAQAVIDDLAERNAGAQPLGSFGVVVGATIGESVAKLAGLNGPYLVPGIGAQGGRAEDVRRIFGAQARAVLPSASREVLRAGPDVPSLRAAAERVIADFAFLRPSTDR